MRSLYLQLCAWWLRVGRRMIVTRVDIGFQAVEFCSGKFCLLWLRPACACSAILSGLGSRAPQQYENATAGRKMWADKHNTSYHDRVIHRIKDRRRTTSQIIQKIQWECSQVAGFVWHPAATKVRTVQKRGL